LSTRNEHYPRSICPQPLYPPLCHVVVLMVLRLPISPRDRHSARPSPIDTRAMCLGRPYKGRPQLFHWSGNTTRPVGERSPIFQHDFKLSPCRTRPGREPPGKAAWYRAFDVSEWHVEPDFG